MKVTTGSGMGIWGYNVDAPCAYADARDVTMLWGSVRRPEATTTSQHFCPRAVAA